MAFCEHGRQRHDHVLVQLLDVDARKAQELVLGLAAQHDPLTGLGNRSLLVARIEAMREPEQQVGQTPQSLIEQADRAMYQRKQSRARV